ncbi:MAG: hypothetical protein CME62_04615 [Halobacteriovoraceae bacterium]|nr:hypothetical protein [Halobacteriovoraceae bacterium]|tara:strand:+ start:1151 stop:1597 length:447 start_codon:yes stop_codon:yes gene_type:complete
MSKVRVLPFDKTIEVDDKLSLRDHLLKNDFAIKSTCGGCASCALCSVIIKSGEENLTEIAFEEKQLLGNVFHITRERLSCQTWVKGDITVDISAHVSHMTKKTKVIRKSKSDQEALKENEENFEAKPVKQGGFKKPRAFKYDDEEQGE